MSEPTTDHARRLREFVGIRFDPLAFGEVGRMLGDRPADAAFAYVVTPNVDHIVRLEREGELLALYQAAWLRLCDSRILAALGRRHGVDLPVVTGSDLTAHVLRDLVRTGDRIAVIGGGETTAARLRELLPGVEVLQHRPPFGLRHDPVAVEQAVRFVVDARARFTFLAVGSPQQEMLAFALSRTAATGIGLCVGASIDFLTGERRRAPFWMRRAGLEWGWRLLSEPQRMWRRYLVEGPRILRIANAWARKPRLDRDPGNGKLAIFATVGTQLPFPRLVDALERIAAAHEVSIFVQTADDHPSSRHLRTTAHISPSDFEARVRSADLLVGHAGIGTVLSAKRFGKPLIVFPRRAVLGEHRNDHQAATARFLDGVTGVHVAWDEAALEALIAGRRLAPADASGGATRTMLVERLRGFIDAA